MPPTEDRIPSLFAIPMILVFVAIILFIGLVQRHGELSLMAGLVLFVFGGAYGWSKLSSARLKCRMTVDKRRMFPGEDFSVAVWVENAKPLPIWVRVQVSEYEQTDAFAPPCRVYGPMRVVVVSENPVPLAGDGLAARGSTPWGCPMSPPLICLVFSPSTIGRSRKKSLCIPG